MNVNDVMGSGMPINWQKVPEPPAKVRNESEQSVQFQVKNGQNDMEKRRDEVREVAGSESQEKARSRNHRGQNVDVMA